MSERAIDIILGAIVAVVLTIAIVGGTIALAWWAGMDPRNDFWGNALSYIGVLSIAISAWFVGMGYVLDNFWTNPEKLREIQAKTAKYYR